MDDKYYKLQDIVIDTFDLDAPLEIEKGVLLLDRNSRNIFLQLKINVLNVDLDQLSSVSLQIDCLDDAMEIITDISPYIFAFRDIFLIKSKTFGEDSPIQLDQRVRRVRVGIDKVVYTDTSTWKPTAQGFTRSKQELINSLKPELVEQLQRDIRFLAPAKKERYVFIPKQLEDYWLCTCGKPNKNDDIVCSRCRLSKKDVFLISSDSLQKNLDAHEQNILIEEEKARIQIEQAKNRENEKIRLQDEEKAKTREVERARSKRLTIVFSLIVFFTIVSFIYTILPSTRYTRATNYLANNDFEKAESIFEALGDYKNSKEMVTETYYQKGLWSLNDSGQFEESISIFKTLGDYKNSLELVKESKYKYGEQQYLEGNFEAAQIILNEFPDYKESGTYLHNLQILQSVQGTWEHNPDKLLFVKWEVTRFHFGLRSGHVKLTEKDIEDNMLYIRSLVNKNYVYDYDKQELYRLPLVEKLVFSKTSTEVLNSSNSSGSSSSPSSTSSSSSQCKTLRDNLDFALYLSGGGETDLTRFYRKALRDEKCGN